MQLQFKIDFFYINFLDVLLPNISRCLNVTLLGNISFSIKVFCFNGFSLLRIHFMAYKRH